VTEPTKTPVNVTATKIYLPEGDVLI